MHAARIEEGSNTAEKRKIHNKCAENSFEMRNVEKGEQQEEIHGYGTKLKWEVHQL